VLRPQDPVQTFQFLPEKETASTSKFSAIDPLSQYATSFTFSDGTMDFGPTMVYALMANGDIYTMGPVLPLHAEVPATYLQSLQAWMEEKERQLDADDGSAAHAALVGRTALQMAWVNAVVRQAGGEEDKDHSAPPRGYGLRDPSPPPPVTSRPPPPPGMVRVHPPHLSESGGPAPGVHRPLMRQGPLLLDPAPQEVGNGDDVDEQMATDLAIIRARGDKEKKEGGDSDGQRINVLAIAWSGGRVDLGVEVTPPEPRWMSSRDPGGVDLYLPVIESVLVTFPQNADYEAIAANAPVFVPDTIHPDVVYLQHSFGIDAISVAPWIGQLLSGDDDELERSDVACLVEVS
jgi:nucleoporin NUP82